MVLMAILVDQQTIHNAHLIQRISSARNAQVLAAVQIALINRYMVLLLLRLHHMPRADQPAFVVIKALQML